MYIRLRDRQTHRDRQTEADRQTDREKRHAKRHLNRQTDEKQRLMIMFDFKPLK